MYSVMLARPCDLDVAHNDAEGPSHFSKIDPIPPLSTGFLGCAEQLIAWNPNASGQGMRGGIMTYCQSAPEDICCKTPPGCKKAKMIAFPDKYMVVAGFSGAFLSRREPRMTRHSKITYASSEMSLDYQLLLRLCCHHSSLHQI